MSPSDLIGLQQLEADARAMRAARKPPSPNEPELTERANMRGLVCNAIDARLWYNLAGTKLLRHGRPPQKQALALISNLSMADLWSEGCDDFGSYAIGASPSQAQERPTLATMKRVRDATNPGTVN
jgi:hypothetical protein